MAIADGQEVAQYVDVDQFDGKSVDKCGFYAVFQNVFATHPGVALADSPSEIALQIAQAADQAYTQYDGADTAANHNGMTLEQLYRLIVQTGHHFQNLYPDVPLPLAQLGTFMRYWIGLGYPVLISVDEATVNDKALGGCPYSWKPAPGEYSHIITVTGTNGPDWLCRDTASIDASGHVRPGPRCYVGAGLKLSSATVFVPPWLTRPVDATHQLAQQPVLAAHKAAALVAITQLQDAVTNYWGQ